MKVVILAGGLGTRLAEETESVPKPMVEVGGRPILWHIMKMYSHWGFTEFVVLTGYKSHMIKDYFINYYARYSDITIDMTSNVVEMHNMHTEPWKVTLLYTGPNTMTGGRLLRAREFLKDSRFMLTYGDGVSDVNIPLLLQCHINSKKPATVTAVRPFGRFGVMDIDPRGSVSSFKEKGDTVTSWVNGGFFVLEPAIFDYLQEGDDTVFESSPLETLTKQGMLNAYEHNGFWRCMDTLKDKMELTHLWNSGNAPWALWSKHNA